VRPYARALQKRSNVSPPPGEPHGQRVDDVGAVERTNGAVRLRQVDTEARGLRQVELGEQVAWKRLLRPNGGQGATWNAQREGDNDRNKQRPYRLDRASYSPWS
jgi:hypothetical protein